MQASLASNIIKQLVAGTVYNVTLAIAGHDDAVSATLLHGFSKQQYKKMYFAA
jgi:hypothetical protein